MKVLKVLGVIVLLIVVGVGGLMYYVFGRLDSLVIEAVEKYGSQAVGTQVTLEDVNIDFGQGRVELLGFQIANPPGYSTPYAFAFSQVAVQIDPNSYTGGAIIVDEISIDQPSINAEEKSLSQMNLTDLSKNLEKGGEPSAEPSSSSGEPVDLPNVAVTEFNFSRANISFVSEQYGDKTIEMPSFTAKNLGGEDGLPPDQLAIALVNELLKQTTNAVKNASRDAVKKEVRDRAKDLLDEKLSDEDKQKLEDVKSEVKSLFNR